LFVIEGRKGRRHVSFVSRPRHATMAKRCATGA